MNRTPGNGIGLSYYEFGATAFFASRADQRFSYCLYMPQSYDEKADEIYPLLVLIHGTERGTQGFRDRYIDFVEQHQCMVLAPLFPCGIEEPRELDNYKYIECCGIRYDLLLLDMIVEISERYRISSDRFLMHGFSGGGHFVHRFLYLHPDHLLAASIGAPGVVTLLDESKPWWVGTDGMDSIFGKTPSVEAMRNVQVQMIVGAEDIETWEITVEEGSPRWMPGVNDADNTRIDQLTALRDSFARPGIAVKLDVIPGVGHQEFAPTLLAMVKSFLAAAMSPQNLLLT